MVRSEICRAPIAAFARIYAHCGADAGIGDRSQRRGFQHPECVPAAVAECVPAQSLYGIWRTATNDMALSYPDYLDLRDRNRSFENLTAYGITLAGMDTGQDPYRVWIDEATGNYFDALGLQPYLGRMFHDSDEHGPDTAPYIVLTHAFWHSHFQDDRGVIGRVVRVNKHPFTIIGVAPPGFHGTLSFFNPDLFVPIVNHPVFGEEDFHDRGNRWLFMAIGHLKSGVFPGTGGG